MTFRAGSLVLAFLGVGCNADTDDLFANTESSSSGKNSSSAASMVTTSTSSGAGGMGGAPAQTASVTTGAMVTSSTGGGPSSSNASTTGSGMTGTDVFCNNQMCSPNQVCCYSNVAPTDHCGAKGTCVLDAQLECNGPDDCPNGQCCGKKSGNNWSSTKCEPQCDGGEIVMCFGEPNACGSGEACKPVPELGQGWASCVDGG